MSRSVLASTVLLALLLAAGPAASQEERGSLTLAWDDCRLSGGGLSNLRSTCTDQGPDYVLVAAFLPNAASNLQWTCAGDFEVDIWTDATLPAWWQHGSPPSCRGPGNIVADYTNSVAAACAFDYWNGVTGGPAGAFSYHYWSPYPNHATLRVVVAVDPAAARNAPQPPPGRETFLFGVSFRRSLTTRCPGCEVPACLTFSRAQLFQGNSDDFTITATARCPSYPDGPSFCPDAPPPSACAHWQHDDPVPAIRPTWGSIKATYR